MVRYLYLTIYTLLILGCTSRDKIDIGEIRIDRGGKLNGSLERYISFTPEFFENRSYSVNRYCEDKRAILTDDKFSTEIYLKVINQRPRPL